MNQMLILPIEIESKLWKVNLSCLWPDSFTIPEWSCDSSGVMGTRLVGRVCVCREADLCTGLLWAFCIRCCWDTSSPRSVIGLIPPFDFLPDSNFMIAISMNGQILHNSAWVSEWSWSIIFFDTLLPFNYKGQLFVCLYLLAETYADVRSTITFFDCPTTVFQWLGFLTFYPVLFSWGNIIFSFKTLYINLGEYC